MNSCCGGGFATSTDEQFGAERAASDLEGYRANGPGVTTRLLRDSIAAAGSIDGASLLDIGAGIGVLTFELFGRGVTCGTIVDASPAYIDVGSAEAARRGHADTIRFIQGDFLQVAREVPSATIVTLDRVICCYPTYDGLLHQSLRRADRYFAFSYPRDVLYVRAADACANGIRRLQGRVFRTFVHPAREMAGIIASAGFERVARRHTWTWCVDVYRKTGHAEAVSAV